MPFEIDGGLYARMYGPTTGDRVRLGDTNLLVEVERDDASPGNERLWDFGNPDRDGKLPVTLGTTGRPQHSG
jgi:urease subunit alpha